MLPCKLGAPGQEHEETRFGGHVERQLPSTQKVRPCSHVGRTEEGHKEISRTHKLGQGYEWYVGRGQTDPFV